MKTITYNKDRINELDINQVIKRAKVIFTNDKNEILLCCSENNYFLVGGHVEGNESDIDCLSREIQEETGVELNLTEEPNLFLTIKHLDKNFPDSGVNTLSLINYYALNTSINPCLENTNLTEEEKNGNFRLEFVDLNQAEEKLNNSLATATIKDVVTDTLEAVIQYKKVITYN